jgi:hypothetical protein
MISRDIERVGGKKGVALFGQDREYSSNAKFGIRNLEFGMRKHTRSLPNFSSNRIQTSELILIFLVAVSLSVDHGQPAAASSTPAEACALLTNAEIEPVLGEPVKERKPGTQATGGLLTSQCFFGTSSARSVSLTVTRANAAGRSTLAPREYWRRQFHPHESEKERDTQARPIAGVGDEAYWTGNRFAGALYVLRGNAFLRISVGGIPDEQARIAAAKALALAALKRL